MENKADQYIESLISEVSELNDKNKYLLEEVQFYKNLHKKKAEKIGILNGDGLRLLEENKQLKSRIKELENTIAYYINEQLKTRNNDR